jgi:chromate transport protein ChrA
MHVEESESMDEEVYNTYQHSSMWFCFFALLSLFLSPSVFVVVTVVCLYMRVPTHSVVNLPRAQYTPCVEC